MSDNQTSEIVSRVKRRAQDMGFSLRKVSLLSGHGPDLIRDWKGKKNALPRLDSIEKIARVLNVSAGWLAFGEGDDKVATTSVPLISWVAASPFAETGFIDHPSSENYVVVDDLKGGPYFALNVKGDSMNLIAPESSLIIVDASDKELISRKFYVFQNRDGATFKRFMSNPDRLEPYSSNPQHEALAIDHTTTVLGRVVKVISNLL